jgi:hypothetical protein
MMAWIIISSIALAMSLITSLAIHPALVDSGLAVWAVVLIDSVIGLATMLILIYLVAPALNEAFAPETEVKEVDPASDPAAGKEEQTKKL